MTPEAEIKAKELIEKFLPYVIVGAREHNAKACAIICVENTIELLESLHKPEYTAFLLKDKVTIVDSEYEEYYNGYEVLEFLNQVKQFLKQ